MAALGEQLADGADWERVLNDFELDRPHVQEAFTWSCASGAGDTAAARACVAFVVGPGLLLLDHRREPAERLEWLRRALPFAKSLGDTDASLGILANIGIALKELGKPREALAADLEMLRTARRMRDRFHVARSCSGLGVALRHLGDLPRALRWHQRALALSRDGVSADVELNATNNIAVVLAELGNLAGALDGFRRAAELAEKLGRPREQAQALGNCGQALCDLGKPAEAIPLIERSIETARASRLARQEVVGLGQLGQALERIGNLGRALDLHLAQVEAARKFGAPREMGNALVNLGCTLMRKDGPASEARARFQEGIAELARAEAGLSQAIALERWSAALLVHGLDAEAAAAAGQATTFRSGLRRT